MEPQILNNNESALTHRTKINDNFEDISDIVNELLDRTATSESDKADKVVGAVNNEVALLDSSGNLKGSNIELSGLATAQQLNFHDHTDPFAHSTLFEAKANKPVSLTATLISSNWTTTIPYSQVVTIQGITSTTTGFIGIPDSATREQYETAISANLRKASQATNTVTFYAYGERPSINIPIEIIIFG